MSAALSINNGEMALVCFPFVSSFKECEVFDSKISTSTFKTSYSHSNAKLGLYRGKATTVGGSHGAENKNKVETLTLSGWKDLNDFPKKYLKKSYLLIF